MNNAMFHYKDLLIEIFILELFLKSYEEEYKNIYNNSIEVKLKRIATTYYRKERITGGLTQIPFYDAIVKADEVSIK
ncbi:hypothetical protein [Alkalihalobacillus trypoxylicola]|uniref:Uncharacterized protein n=1 Tax=Alkalihalobacillus trypoxylicola TaxID=519424 RepID=A0A162DMM3_9BACI|nr:hypothetical protein [Alkalihalobacillus trypoxylicola]KYG30040.1 hypothetical protein AZF04_20055 [Alkalihalobacillus trypoxylicola]